MKTIPMLGKDGLPQEGKFLNVYQVKGLLGVTRAAGGKRFTITHLPTSMVVWGPPPTVASNGWDVTTKGLAPMAAAADWRKITTVRDDPKRLFTSAELKQIKEIQMEMKRTMEIRDAKRLGF